MALALPMPEHVFDGYSQTAVIEVRPQVPFRARSLMIHTRSVEVPWVPTAADLVTLEVMRDAIEDCGEVIAAHEHTAIADWAPDGGMLTAWGERLARLRAQLSPRPVVNGWKPVTQEGCALPSLSIIDIRFGNTSAFLNQNGVPARVMVEVGGTIDFLVTPAQVIGLVLLVPPKATGVVRGTWFGEVVQ